MFSTLLFFLPIFVFIINIIFLILTPFQPPDHTSPPPHPHIPPILAVLFFFFFLVQFFPLNSIDLSFVILISFDFGFLFFIFYFIYNPGYLLVVLKILTT